MRRTPVIRILLLEDDPDYAELSRKALRKEESVRFDVRHAARLSAAFELLASEQFDAVLSDLGLPDSKGLETFFRLRDRYPDIPIVVLSGTSDEELAVTSVQNGAQDYLVKGEFDGRLLSRTIRHAIERKKLMLKFERSLSQIKSLENENTYLRSAMTSESRFDSIIGNSGEIASVLNNIRQVAPTDATVLLTGETGTGKGLFARSLHTLSRRKDRPFVHVNCAALPASLVESELFGRERGAFTGAAERQIGRFELANHGTLFLDEIGEMPLELQPKLLKVIEEGSFERLGSPKTVQVDVRIVASTNRDLKKEIAREHFREDLYHRLNVFPVMIPPLRQRKSDIPILVDYYMRKFSAKYGKSITELPAAAVAALENHEWQGNIRELMNVVERAVITTTGQILNLSDSVAPDAVPDFADSGSNGAERKATRLAEVEREHIIRTLSENHWRVEGSSGVAQKLGMNPSTLRARMRKLGIKRPGAT